jgi:hypothetical protein
VLQPRTGATRQGQRPQGRLHPDGQPLCRQPGPVSRALPLAVPSVVDSHRIQVFVALTVQHLLLTQPRLGGWPSTTQFSTSALTMNDLAHPFHHLHHRKRIALHIALPILSIPHFRTAILTV